MFIYVILALNLIPRVAEDGAMKYSFLIYGSEGMINQLPANVSEHVLDLHHALNKSLAERGAFWTGQLMRTDSAVTVMRGRKAEEPPVVVDGPFSDTKEQFLGFYIADFDSLEDAVEVAATISVPHMKIEVRPLRWVGGAFAE